MNFEGGLTEAGAVAAANRIESLYLDVDGTLTDGKLYYSEEGIRSRAYCTLDGEGIFRLREIGVSVVFLTRSDVGDADYRAKDLACYYFPNVQDKAAFIRSEQRFRKLERMAFVGNDEPDFSCLPLVGLFFVPADGLIPTGKRCRTGRGGGNGAVREVCDFIIEAKRGQ